MLALLLLLSCTPQGPTFGLSRAQGPTDELFFNNQAEPETLDPGLATGMPDARIIGELFDGLTDYHPVNPDPVPGTAERWERHPDGRGYTFHLRPEATWTDGTPLTAEDFAWSWQRVLNPIFLSRYAQQLYPVQHAERFNQGRAQVLTRAVGGLGAGTAVELVESRVVRTTRESPVHDGPDGPLLAMLPQGVTVAFEPHDADWLRVRFRPACPDLGDQRALRACTGAPVEGHLPSGAASPAFPLVNERVVDRPVGLVDREEQPVRGADGRPMATLRAGDRVHLLRLEDQRAWVYVGERERFGWLPLDALAHPRGEEVRFLATPLPLTDWQAPLGAGEREDGGEPEPAEPVWVQAADLVTSPEVLGFHAADDHTLHVRLEGVAPYFLELTSHTTLRAVPRQAIERHGARWTRPEHIVSSGPFRLVEHRVRDRMVLQRNEDWWGAETVRLRRVTAYAIDNLHTTANLYRAGYTDLVVGGDIPAEFMPILHDMEDFRVSPALGTYFFRFNVTREPLHDVRVRRALALAIDRGEIAAMLKGGQIPTGSLVPPGIPGYGGHQGPGFDPEEARRLLAEAGYPEGQGFPELTVLYNTLEMHRQVAAVLQEQWRRHLGVRIRLENREWMTYLSAMNALDYDIARAGWIGDYLDPNTFLELWVTDGGNNNTGWSHAEYDALIAAAAREPDPQRRFALFEQAEALFHQELPAVPVYWYVWPELLQPDVRGHHPHPMDRHPLRYVWLDR